MPPFGMHQPMYRLAIHNQTHPNACTHGNISQRLLDRVIAELKFCPGTSVHIGVYGKFFWLRNNAFQLRKQREEAPLCFRSVLNRTKGGRDFAQIKGAEGRDAHLGHGFIYEIFWNSLHQVLGGKGLNLQFVNNFEILVKKLRFGW